MSDYTSCLGSVLFYECEDCSSGFETRFNSAKTRDGNNIVWDGVPLSDLFDAEGAGLSWTVDISRYKGHEEDFKYSTYTLKSPTLNDPRYAWHLKADSMPSVNGYIEPIVNYLRDMASDDNSCLGKDDDRRVGYKLSIDLDLGIASNNVVGWEYGLPDNDGEGCQLYWCAILHDYVNTDDPAIMHSIDFDATQFIGGVSLIGKFPSGQCSAEGAQLHYCFEFLSLQEYSTTEDALSDLLGTMLDLYHA